MHCTIIQRCSSPIKAFYNQFYRFFYFYFQSVLVETQDKALRRISELKEQCSLEQSAKVNIFNSHL